jgi:phosphoribosyl 1,2-cyclic phosphodiesterase
MFQTSVLASGSKGNCILIRSRNTALILDAGISLKRVWAALEDLDVPRHTIQAVIVSHEHSDHTRSAGAMARSLKIPLFISPDTYDYCAHRLGKVENWLRYFESGVEFLVGDILVRPFRSSHDAIDSNNFYFEHNDRRVGVAIDLGYPTKLTVRMLSQVHALILESNHDPEMLRNGPYDPSLQQRVRSEHGHLSNAEAVGLITQVLHPGLKNLVLAHLSETNNLPDLAFEVMNKYLQSIRSEVKLHVASQHAHTGLIDI